MKKIIAVSLIATVFSACSSLKYDYKVMDASLSKRPDWFTEPAKVEKDKAVAAKYRYFFGENENASKRLCETGARADADKKLAAEIAQLIKNTYAESVQSEDDEVSSYSEEALAKNVKITVSGSQLATMYWEKRAYDVELGAEKDKKTYFCHAVSRIEKNKLERVVDASINQFVRSLNDTKAKDKALEALKAAEQEFVKAAE